MRLVLLFFFLYPTLLILLLSSCGPAWPIPLKSKDVDETSKQAIQKSQSSSLAQNLDLKIIPASDALRGQIGFNQPQEDGGSHFYADLNQSIQVDQNQISYRKSLHLPQPTSADPLLRKEIFFVWVETVLNVRILQSWVSLRKLDGNNHWLGSNKLIPAHYDSLGRRWFISISELMNQGGSTPSEPANSAETQVMNLELVLSDQTRAVIKVRFRLRDQE